MLYTLILGGEKQFRYNELLESVKSGYDLDDKNYRTYKSATQEKLNGEK